MEAFMNWKENAYLFTNGNFQAKYGDGIYVIYGIVGRTYLICRAWQKDIYCPIKKSTLIARKIEDMTDGEIKWFLINEKYPTSKPYADDMRQFIPKWAKNNEFTQDQFLYLLSIGVYPFSQKHFEDETVIDIKTL